MEEDHKTVVMEKDAQEEKISAHAVVATDVAAPIGGGDDDGSADAGKAEAKDIPSPEISEQKIAKKRTWKKPKDKPKRPLSAYNIFFQHARARIVEGETGEATPEEVVQSIEGILSKSREKRRHRKSHGRISFGDLARSIADQWKSISPRNKEIFDHYAEIDMVRYRRELKVWKDKKERENEINAAEKHSRFINQMGSSMSSTASDAFQVDDLPDESNSSSVAGMHESFNSSHSSLGDFNSSERRKMNSDSMNMMIQRQQQILQNQLQHGNPTFKNSAMQFNTQNHPGNLPGSNAFHQSFQNLPNFSSSQGQFSDPMQTMKELKMKQALQMQEMRQLQQQQMQIEQQLQMHQNSYQNTNFNLQQLGHSSVPNFVGNQNMMSQNINEISMQQTPFLANNSLANRNNAFQGDSMIGQSTHQISDYSSSSGFGNGSFSESFATTSSHRNAFNNSGSASFHLDQSNASLLDNSFANINMMSNTPLQRQRQRQQQQQLHSMQKAQTGTFSFPSNQQSMNAKGQNGMMDTDA